MNEIFKLNDLLAVNSSIRVEHDINSETGMMLIMIDDILKNFDKAHSVISNSPATDWKNAATGKNFIDYREGRLQFPVRNYNQLIDISKQAIEHYHHVNTEFQFGTIDVNVFQQMTPRTNDFNIVHTDQRRTGRRSFTCLLFMNTDEQSSGGTAFFQHLPSKKYSADDVELGELLDSNPELWHNGVNYWNQDDGTVWQMTDYAEMKSNRLIIFPSEYFHTAYHPVDSFYDFSRLTLVYWLAEP